MTVIFTLTYLQNVFRHFKIHCISNQLTKKLLNCKFLNAQNGISGRDLMTHTVKRSVVDTYALDEVERRLQGMCPNHCHKFHLFFGNIARGGGYSLLEGLRDLLVIYL